MLLGTGAKKLRKGGAGIFAGWRGGCAREITGVHSLKAMLPGGPADEPL